MRYFVLLLAVSTIPTVASAQQPVSLESKISDSLTRMKNDDLSTREAAFDKIITTISGDKDEEHISGKAAILTKFFTQHPDEADRVKLGFIHLLSSENEVFVKDNPGTLTEEDGEYYAEVIDTVSSLNDERAIPALVGAMTTGGIVQRALLKFGDKAIGPVMSQLHNPDALIRATALGMSVALLEKQNDSASRKHAIDLIQLSLVDPVVGYFEFEPE